MKASLEKIAQETERKRKSLQSDEDTVDPERLNPDELLKIRCKTIRKQPLESSMSKVRKTSLLEQWQLRSQANKTEIK